MFPGRMLSPFLAFATLGCADMLGLGGLTYDQGELEETVAGAGGVLGSAGGSMQGSGGAPAILGDGDVYLGGASGGTTPESFSLLLDRAALLAAAPRPTESPECFIFEPRLAQLSYHRKSGEAVNLVGTWDWPSTDGFSHLAAVPFPGGITLIGYDRASGFTSQATLDDEGEFRILSSDIGTSGRTALVPLFTGAEWLAFVYSADDGNYRYFRPLPSTEPELFAGGSEPGWTSIARFSSGGDMGLLKHDNTTGLLQFDRFVAHGEPLSPVFTVQLGETFSHMVTFEEDEILFYSFGSGTVVTGKVLEEQGQTRFVKREEGFFRGDLSQIAPLAALEGASALTFSSESGRAVLNSLRPLDDNGPVVVR